jgi:endonuclease/exonuclease/phosphatase family metal-dependent hydrolase
VAAVAVGGIITLELLFLANPAYVAAAAHTSLSDATAIVLVALAAAAVALVWVERRPVVLVAVAATIGAGLALPTAKGDSTTLWVVAAAAGAAILLARLLAPLVEENRPRRGARFLALGWLVPILFTLLYQLHYDRALPVSNRYLTGAAGVLALLALHTRPVDAPPSHRRVGALGPGVLLAAIVLVAVAGLTGAKALSPVDRATTPSPARTTLRVVQWNVHQAVDDGGQLDPAALARAIAGQGPVDVVVLNEVGRGWPLSGQLDLASWLSHRLDLPFRWAGAASASFGNLVLSRLPVQASELLALPTAPGAQGRSALRVTLGTGGAPVHVVATHLQHRNDAKAMAARLQELDWIVERWGATPRTIVVGDLNPEQGDPPAYSERRPIQFPEIGVLLRAGMSTAADLTSCAAPTSGRNCSDYVFVTGDLHEQALSVVAAGATDHRMLVADVPLPAGS